MSRKFTCKTILTSQLMPDGNHYDFKAGEVIDEKFINTVQIEKYLESGLLSVADPDSQDSPAQKIKPTKTSVKKKTEARKACEKSLAQIEADKEKDPEAIKVK